MKTLWQTFITIVVLSLTAETAVAAKITATATGSLTPPTAAFPDTVTNGDFLITGNPDPTAVIVGNIRNEITTWDFDFTSDPDFPTFPIQKELRSALLTMTLTTCCAINTDLVKIEGLPHIATNDIQELPPNVTETITLDLLDFYSSSDILNVLNGSNIGEIPMRYIDDAIVSFAELELISTSTPEPSTLLGLGTLALAGSTLLRRKRKA